MMKNSLILLCLISIITISCKKDETTTKKPADYTQEDFIGRYSLNYSHRVVLTTQSGLQISDTTVSGTRTIFISKPDGSNSCPVTDDRIVFKNLRGNGTSVCARIFGNTYNIDNAAFEKGEGSLVDDKLSVNINTPFNGKPTDNIKGSAYKE